MFVSTDEIYFREARLSDLDRIHTLEAAGYPEDEAASYEKLKFRLTHAEGLFLAAVVRGPSDTPLENPKDVLIGYICSTLTTSPTLTHGKTNLTRIHETT
jgi:guanine nucleotide exchange factor